MCRNIRPLFNYDPPSTQEDSYAAALQFVRKVSGYTKPSKANEAIFYKSVEDIADKVEHLLAHLQTNAPPRNRQEEIERARERNRIRFGQA
ncbi:MAG: DUF2277 domain-containing protein [Saprospiraceae bacterium]|nr:DUF2277 domain-containing protein [Saprospiraceae bacterium]